MNLFYRPIIVVAFGLILLSGVNRSHAQQQQIFSQYMFNSLAYNPGYAGSRELLNATLVHRSQWTGFEGAPTTQSLTIHTPLPIDKIALGFTVLNDKLGPVKQTFLAGDVAYRIRFDNSTLSFGAKAGVNLFQGAFSELVTSQSSDNLLSQNYSSSWFPNVGFGVYYYSDNYYLGLSAPRVIKNDFDGNVAQNAITNGSEEVHYMLTAGYVLELTSAVKFKPSILVRVVNNAPLGADFNAAFLFNDRIWVGVHNRFRSSWGITAQYQVTEQLRLGYSYEISSNSLRSYNNGSHEVMLSYDFGFSKRKFKSPRYF